MDRLEVSAHGKINLSLDIVGKEENGYHSVRMIMQTIRLYDRIEIQKTTDGQIRTAGNLSYVPNNETNLAYKAADAFRKATGTSDGLFIRMQKRIPVGGGLGGGSADAAAVLQGLNRMYGTHLHRNELDALASSIGADVPFCLRRGTYLAEGIGEKLSHLPQFPGRSVVLVKPPFGVSTKWVYQNLRWQEIQKRPDTGELIRALAQKNTACFYGSMANVLEEVVFPSYPVIAKLKERMLLLGADAAMMSGSGATVFGIFEDNEKAKSVLDAFRREGKETYLTETISSFSE